MDLKKWATKPLQWVATLHHVTNLLNMGVGTCDCVCFHDIFKDLGYFLHEQWICLSKSAKHCKGFVAYCTSNNQLWTLRQCWRHALFHSLFTGWDFEKTQPWNRWGISWQPQSLGFTKYTQWELHYIGTVYMGIYTWYRYITYGITYKESL